MKRNHNEVDRVCIHNTVHSVDCALNTHAKLMNALTHVCACFKGSAFPRYIKISWIRGFDRKKNANKYIRFCKVPPVVFCVQLWNTKKKFTTFCLLSNLFCPRVLKNEMKSTSFWHLLFIFVKTITHISNHIQLIVKHIIFFSHVLCSSYQPLFLLFIQRTSYTLEIHIISTHWVEM